MMLSVSVLRMMVLMMMMVSDRELVVGVVVPALVVGMLVPSLLMGVRPT